MVFSKACGYQSYGQRCRYPVGGCGTTMGIVDRNVGWIEVANIGLFESGDYVEGHG